MLLKAQKRAWSVGYQSMTVDIRQYEGCVRAFGSLAGAYLRVAEELRETLQRETGLSITEFDTLAALAREGEMGLTSLTDRTTLSQSAFSRLVARLEQRGLVTRRFDTADRRSVALRLSADGLAKLDAAVPVHSACIQTHLLGRLSIDERMSLKALLEKISGDAEETGIAGRPA